MFFVRINEKNLYEKYNKLNKRELFTIICNSIMLNENLTKQKTQKELDRNLINLYKHTKKYYEVKKWKKNMNIKQMTKF